MNFIRNRNFRAGPQTSLDGFICPQNSKKQLKFRVFGRSGGEKTDIRSEAFFNGKEERLLFGRVLRGIYREIMEMFERIK